MSKKILIADDDPAICDAVQILLEGEGYSVDTTINGATVAKMDRDFPDLLLLDVWMSGQDGREIAQHLKNKATTKHIPIIMVSASRDLQATAQASGADDFLEKPFTLENLLQKIELHLK